MLAPITSPLNTEVSGDLYYLHSPVSYISSLTLFVASGTFGTSGFILKYKRWVMWEKPVRSIAPNACRYRLEFKGITLLKATFLSWYNSRKIQPRGRMISFLNRPASTYRAQAQSLPIHQRGVTPTQSHVTEKMKMPWASDTCHYPRSGFLRRAAAWIIRAGAGVLLFTQDKIKNDKFHFFLPSMIYSAMYWGFSSRASPVGLCRDIAGTLINDGNSVCFPPKESEEILPEQGNPCHLHGVNTSNMPFDCMYFKAHKKHPKARSRFHPPIHYADTPVSQGRWKRLRQVTDTWPDLVNGAIPVTNERGPTAVMRLHLLPVSLHASPSQIKASPSPDEQ